MTLITHIKGIQPIHIIALYVIVYLCLLPFYQYQINPDAVSYIACAKAYANGSFFRAINGYWSPLLCWLLVPFIKAGIEPLLAIKLINLCFSSLALYTLYRLAASYIASPFYRICLLLTCIPHLLILSLTTSTPDLLSLALLFVFVSHALKLIQNPALSEMIITGISGALCYFGKYYNFYGILLLFGVMTGYALFKRKPKTAGYVVAAGLIFALLSCIWMRVIYHKYGVFTPTTASAFNLKLIDQAGPKYPFLSGNGMLALDYERFYYTSWEDSFYYPSDGWAVYPPKQSELDRIFLRIKTNIHGLLLNYYAELFLGAIAVLMLVLKRKSYSAVLYVLLVSAMLYPIGYLFTILEARYVFFSIALALLLFFAVTDTFQLSKLWQAVVGAMCLLIMVNTTYRMAKMPAANRHHELFIRLPLVSKPYNTQIISSPRTWADALYLCYFRDGKLYDTLNPTLTHGEFFDIYPELDYYFCLREEMPEALKKNPVTYIDRFALITLHPEKE